MARAENRDLVDSFEQFYRRYYTDEVGELARNYPREQKSLYLDWTDLYTFDPDIAEEYLSKPEQYRECAEEALRLYDLPVDVSLGQAHVRLQNLDDHTDIRDIRSRHVGRLVSVQGMVRKATDVRPKVQEAAFECQRCGTLTNIPQSGGSFQEPHECQGCERQGPFQVNFDQSEFVDSQKLRIQESPEGLRGGETPQSIDVNIEDDITGEVTPGDHVTVTGVLELDQQENGQEKSAVFDVYMTGQSVEIEDEEFEDMDITDEDKADIVKLGDDPDIYQRMVDSIAPNIYGHEEAKLAMMLQLFSGVTKHLPDGSRTRGDLHMLLIGDPGTGKCLDGDTKVTLADGRERPIREIVEENLDDPESIDDGVYDEVDIPLPSMDANGTITERRATKVWKREAPKTMYRIRTASGREIEVTPSHPLFVQQGGSPRPVRAEDLSEGEFVATPRTLPNDTGRTASRMAAKADGGTDLHWDCIEFIEAVVPSEEWVYDLEVAGTHTYVSNGVVSHNSQMLQYVQNIAPRSVYTSGKGSSAAGLCVTGDTTIHTDDGFVPIRELATEKHPEAVDAETAAPASHDLYTYDGDTGRIEQGESSLVWRMPEKPCRRVETAHGKELEASVNTPVLVCGEHGIEWREISEVGAGDHVAVPSYTDIERSSPSPMEFFEFTGEKLKPDAESASILVDGLREAFGTLRDAAAALDLSEDFVYDSLRNRHLPQDKLDTVLDAIGAERSDLRFERAMLRHGGGISLPDEFDADLLYLIGLIFGDGDMMVSRRGENRGLVRISNNDEALLETAADIMAEAFDKRPEIEYQEERVPCIRLHSATVARFFSNLGVESPKEDIALDPRLTTAEHADAFLRGLFDADGSVCPRDNGGSSVQFSTVCDRLADQVQLMLETYGVRSRTRERDRRGTYERADGHEIESMSVQTHLAIYGAELDAYAERIGFRSAAKAETLDNVVGDTPRTGERLPLGDALLRADGAGGQFYQNLNRGDDPSRERARAMLDDRELGGVGPIVEEAVEADLVWDEVTEVADTGEKEVFDLTVPGTHNFVGNGVVTHNTAAAVRDDFGDGQQWTLEAGALVLADQGIAAVDELDKMRCVTGDTLVHLGDGRIERIGELAREAANDGEIEELPNGRTIRNLDLTAWTMDDNGIVRRDVTAIHEYDAPETLSEVTLETGESLTATDDHPFFVFENGERVERGAAELEAGDWVYVPRSVPPTASDGGVETAVPEPNSGLSDAFDGGDVELRRVETVESVSDGTAKVYDLTVEGTHNFIANGMVVHNSEDQSAMHEALEQQEISVAKAGINATLKSRCSLLGAANPTYGRFDQYEPIGEQIDLDPPLISRFDLIFTVTDKPDEEKDRRLAEHILRTNYAGELNTHRTKMTSSNVKEEEVEAVVEDVAPDIDAEFLRKYIAYSRRNCFPTMTDEAKQTIEDFYVDLRSQGAGEDAPVPVTARKLEALVRLGEASARVRLSDTVDKSDADRVIEIVRSCLMDIGVDPETGEFDADVVETGTSKTQRDRIRGIKEIVGDLQDDYDDGAPIEKILDEAEQHGMERSKAEHEIEKLKQQGELYQPNQDHLRTL